MTEDALGTSPRTPLTQTGLRIIFLFMRRIFPPSPIARISVRPDHEDPNAIVGPRPRGSRRPHTDAAFAAVRRLIEQSTLSYGEIRARTGVSHASICRWARDGGWKRPPFAPRANDLMPTPRASAQLRRRTLAKRLDALAERHIRELEESQCVDPVKLARRWSFCGWRSSPPAAGRGAASAILPSRRNSGARSTNCAPPASTSPAPRARR